jgi:hypothetical protein
VSTADDDVATQLMNTNKQAQERELRAQEKARKKAEKTKEQAATAIIEDGKKDLEEEVVMTVDSQLDATEEPIVEEPQQAEINEAPAEEPLPPQKEPKKKTNNAIPYISKYDIGYTWNGASVDF